MTAGIATSTPSQCRDNACYSDEAASAIEHVRQWPADTDVLRRGRAVGPRDRDAVARHETIRLMGCAHVASFPRPISGVDGVLNAGGTDLRNLRGPGRMNGANETWRRQTAACSL